MKDSDPITTLTQERDAMRMVLTSEIDARIKAESRSLAADGLRVQLADARDRLDLCAAAVERLTQERDLASERIVELLREAQWHRQEWQKMHDQMQEQRVRAEKAETVRDEARDCLGRTVDQRVEAEADRDAAKTRIAAALRCLEGKHYPAAIQALTIGTAQGCVVPPDPAMMKRLEDVTEEREHLRREWDAHEARIRKQERGYAETVASLTAERDAAREQHKALTAALGLAERARDGWRGRALYLDATRVSPTRASLKADHDTREYGWWCPGCQACDEDDCGDAAQPADMCGGSGWVATASPEPARNAPQPDLSIEIPLTKNQVHWAPTSSQRDDLDTLDEGRPDPKGTEKAGHVGWLLSGHDAEWQAKHQGPPAGCKGCAEQIEIPLTEMRRERDEWKARAKEAEDRAGYFAKGRNKASADADKAQRERDEARAEVARLTQTQPVDDTPVRMTPAELLQRGGKWLGATREWLQWNRCHGNGESLRWGSEEEIQPPLKAREVEEIAAAAVATLWPVGAPPAVLDAARVLTRWHYGSNGKHVKVMCAEWQALKKAVDGHPEKVGLDDPLGTAPVGYEPFPDCVCSGKGLCEPCRRRFPHLDRAWDGQRDVPAPIAPEHVEFIEPAPSWERARGAWRAMRALYVETPSSQRTSDLYGAIADSEAGIYRGEKGWINAAQDTHAAINALEKAARDANLWHVPNPERSLSAWGECAVGCGNCGDCREAEERCNAAWAKWYPGVKTPFAQSILALRAATPQPVSHHHPNGAPYCSRCGVHFLASGCMPCEAPRPEPIPTGQEDQHDADMRATEPTTKETP